MTILRLPLRALAPAKINLGLFVGPTRADGRHELVTVMQSISLADELVLENAPAGATSDEIVCPEVAGPPNENLAARALEMFRETTGWNAGPLRLRIDKRIPVAAGLGGGSADAAAALRLAAAAQESADGGLGGGRLLELARELGADVPAQARPGRWLATCAGERLEELPDPIPTFGVLVLPLAEQLSTADVYAAYDRLRSPRASAELQERRRLLHAALDLGIALPTDGELLHNDLQDAARSLCPAIDPLLAAARDAGAQVAFVSGSGPTVVGLFPRANGPDAAKRAAAGLAGLEPAPVVATPVGAAFGQVLDLPVRHN